MIEVLVYRIKEYVHWILCREFMQAMRVCSRYHPIRDNYIPQSTLVSCVLNGTFRQAYGPGHMRICDTGACRPF